MKKDKMLDSKGFDIWADSYDDTVIESQEDESYPFVAYDQVLNEILSLGQESNGRELLDLGFGTGNLTKEFYDLGYRVVGLDFSEEMLKKAEEKMKDGEFLIHDLKNPLPRKIKERKFDTIISSYAIHHLESGKQLELIMELRNLLKDDGVLIIGDVMTMTRSEMESAMERDQDIWDFDENYLVVEEISKNLDFEVEFLKKSYCSGLLVVRKD